MPVKPKIKTLTNNSVDVLNAIRNSASTQYKDYIPVATADSEVIRGIGAVIMDNPSLQNEFLHSLVNRIGRVMVTSRLYSNPIAMFKKGILDYGETIEEIFVKLAKPYQFNPDESQNTLFKREIPSVVAAFHVMNFQEFYKVTVTEDQLRQAFMSAQGVTDLIARIVDSLYTSANYDEFLVMKYMLALAIVKGTIAIKSGYSGTSELVKAIKAESNKLEFMNDKHNFAEVLNQTLKADQYLLVNSTTDANIDVDVMASAFNMSKVEFMGHRVLIDGFGELDINRLNIIFEGDDNYVDLSTHLSALNAIDAVIVDKEWFMVFDNLIKFNEVYNSEGLYWNYFYHTWKTFSYSPYAQAVMFNVSAPGVTSVVCSPDAFTFTAVSQTGFTTPTVTVTNFASKKVTYAISTGGEEYIDVSASGKITCKKMPSVDTTVTITCTSVFDATKSDTITVTLDVA